MGVFTLFCLTKIEHYFSPVPSPAKTQRVRFVSQLHLPPTPATFPAKMKTWPIA